MHFTQEDYKKIESWLLKNSVKDSEFQKAFPVNGNETIVITQEGRNRIMTVSELSNCVLKLGVSDFINVSDSYDAYKITLQEAIDYIPFYLRKRGVIITFYNTSGSWSIYQFTGVENQWNNITLWNNVFSIDNYVINSIIPDEEDLTLTEANDKGNSFLKLKDRKYEPEIFSGLGKKILRKRVLPIEDTAHNISYKNLLTQADLLDSDTIYTILYDFDLNGESITVPSNCILDFAGGSISNGEIVLGNTKIYPNGYFYDFLKNITISGNYATGQCLFDTNLSIPKWWNGTQWVNSLGNIIE